MTDDNYGHIALGLITVAVLFTAIFNTQTGGMMPRVQTFTVEGTLVHKFDVEQITETFSKRPIVVRIEHDKYPQEVKLELVGAAKDLISTLNIGTTVSCTCELTGRSYTKRTDGSTDWFTSVKCFDVQGIGPNSLPKQDGTTVQQEIEDVPF